jgi:hypothetical protein
MRAGEGSDLRSSLADDLKLLCDIIEIDLRRDCKIGG